MRFPLPIFLLIGCNVWGGGDDEPDGQRHKRICVERAAQSAEDVLLQYTMAQDASHLVDDANYMSKQERITSHMRAVLIDWMNEVATDFKVSRETFHTAVHVVDRFLSRVPYVAVSKLQLVGITAMHIASKIEEDVSRLHNRDHAVDVCDGAYTSQHIVKMERFMLRRLEYKIASVRALPSWVWYFLLRAHYDLKLENLRDMSYTDLEPLFSQQKDVFQAVMEILDLCILDPGSSRLGKSELAAAAVSLVVPKIKAMSDVEFKAMTLLERQDIKEAVEFLTPFQIDERQRPEGYSLREQIHYKDGLSLYRAKTAAPGQASQAQQVT